MYNGKMMCSTQDVCSPQLYRDEITASRELGTYYHFSSKAQSIIKQDLAIKTGLKKSAITMEMVYAEQKSMEFMVCPINVKINII
jgi:hypothetical protein